MIFLQKTHNISDVMMVYQSVVFDDVGQVVKDVKIVVFALI